MYYIIILFIHSFCAPAQGYGCCSEKKKRSKSLLHHFFFLIGVQLLYNVVLVSVIQ